eukprot:3374515-Rhodomonas_salina.1
MRCAGGVVAQWVVLGSTIRGGLYRARARWNRGVLVEPVRLSIPRRSISRLPPASSVPSRP